MLGFVSSVRVFSLSLVPEINTIVLSLRVALRAFVMEALFTESSPLVRWDELVL